MRICHVTPHLPPDQSANALLPFHLGQWAVEDGDEPVYIAHTPRSSGVRDLPGPVSWIPRKSTAGAPRGVKGGSLASAGAIIRRLGPIIKSVDLVHIHSNGLLAEMAALVAQWMRRPFVLTLYGTEIWHYRPRWFGFDPFTRAYHRADHVTFYSQLLADRANELGLSRNNTSVVYPPVPEAFSPSDLEERRRVRAALGLRRRHILLNVKRLHPLAGQSYAIEALAAVVKTHPDTQLVFCGTGPLQRDLETLASRLGVERHVTFAGLVENALIARYCAAADVFVLPSLLEACPTVAVEALACGTPVVSSDNPGGIELRALFGDDVSVVPMKQSEALADAISAVLSRRHRVRATATEIIDREFRPRAVSARFREIYGRLLDPAS